MNWILRCAQNDILLFLFLTFFSANLFASSADDVRKLAASGELEKAALQAYITSGGKDGAEMLALTARLLDELHDQFSERYEKKCYWVSGAPQTPECMKKGAKELNEKFGNNAFRYIGGESIAYIEYTGSHYERILKKYKKSSFAEEAEFYLLLQDLQGHPDAVLKRVQRYREKHKSGEWGRRANLLWARVNEDVCFVWRKWTWVVYNGTISDDELIIKSEPYRQEALRTYESLIKNDAGSLEAKLAAEDLQKLKTQGDDGALYSITNDSAPGTWKKWGLRVP